MRRHLLSAMLISIASIGTFTPKLAFAEWHLAWSLDGVVANGPCSTDLMNAPRDLDNDGRMEFAVLTSGPSGRQLRIVDLVTGQTEFSLDAPPGMDPWFIILLDTSQDTQKIDILVQFQVPGSSQYLLQLVRS